MTSSLISFSKREIAEEIPGMIIGTYRLPVDENGFILHVEDSAYYKPDNEGNQDRVYVSSEDIVRSLVKMHLTAQLAARHDAYPALFCVPNVAVTRDMLSSHPEIVSAKKEALAAQRRWFIALTQMADDDWQTYRHHRMISDLQRTAAKELGLKREWIDYIADEEERPNCPFCGTGLLDVNAPICPSCGQIHNPTKFKALQAKLGITSVSAEPKKTQ
jgi:hypothetical protein